MTILLQVYSRTYGATCSTPMDAVMIHKTKNLKQTENDFFLFLNFVP